MTEPQPADALTTWEEHYAAKPQVWSGRVNAVLADIAGQLPAGRALDLGCGEGGDAIWLAEQGWTVVAVDVSTTALERGRAAAQQRGVDGRIDFQQHDLDTGFPAGLYDLVSAQFLHSPVEKDRPAILRRAVAAVAPGGTLLIVDHAAAPPWATRMKDHVFPTVEAVLAGLELDPAEWKPIHVGGVERTVQGPDGQTAVLADNVIRIRRAGPPGNC